MTHLRVRGKSKHVRSVTRFCEEANIEEADQLDLAEFIVAAHYLGTEANDEQLMDVFTDMETTMGDSEKNPKEMIRDLLATVEEKYGVKGIDEGDDKEEEGADQEVMEISPLDAFQEDAKWQDQQLGGFLSDAYAEQNLKIAQNLLDTTALSLQQISDLTGVDVAKLEELEEEEEYDSLEEDEDFDDGKETEKPLSAEKAGVVIEAATFNKTLAITTEEMNNLNAIVQGGAAKVAERKEEALALLRKLRIAVGLSPQGMKKMKTVRKLLAAPTDKKSEEKPKEKEEKFPRKYRVVIHPGALVKASKEVKSKEVAKVPIGSVVLVEEIDGRRARISQPVEGWCSLHSADKRVILQKEGTKSKLMQKAVHADRARQTKILILKSITTLNEATVQRILEKSDWNLRRAIEAFYIAKYKTQEYLKQKEDDTKADPAKPGKPGKKKKGKLAFWKSWKNFAANN